MEAVLATAALVLENERLAAEVRSQLAEVRASRTRIVAATDAERRRIERNLHDGAQQRLVTLSLTLGSRQARAGCRGLGCARPARVTRSTRRSQSCVSSRVAFTRPCSVSEGLADGARGAREADSTAGVACEGIAGGRLPDAVELAAYFLVSEALTNVVKHAQATEATVLPRAHARTLRVAIADDGVGGAHVPPDSGLAGLRDRFEVARRQRCVIESEPGAGHHAQRRDPMRVVIADDAR